jgi:hypothetical protein
MILLEFSRSRITRIELPSFVPYRRKHFQFDTCINCPNPELHTLHSDGLRYYFCLYMPRLIHDDSFHFCVFREAFSDTVILVVYAGKQ